MKIEIEKRCIDQYLELLVKKNLDGEELKHHSIPCYIILCIVVLGLNIFSVMCHEGGWQLLIFLIVAIVLLIRAICFIRKKDYSYFLYIPHMWTSINISLLSLMLGRSVEISETVFLMSIAVYFLGAVLFTRVFFNSLVQQIKEGTVGEDSIGSGGIIVTVGMIGAAVGTIISRWLPTMIQIMLFPAMMSFLFGFNVYSIMPYILGKQYDPTGSYIKSCKRTKETTE